MVRHFRRHALAILPLTLLSSVAHAEEPDTEGQGLNAKAVAQMTPAQKRYGLPRNPIVGGAVDLDISKPLTLERAIRIGLALQNSIAQSQAQYESASARLTQARAQYFPQLQPRLQYNAALQPGGVINFGGNLIRASNSTEVFSTGINANFTIWDTGIRENNIGASRRNTFASAYSIANQRQTVILAVTQAYYTLNRARALVTVQSNSVRRAQANLEIIQAAATVGTAAKSDTLQAEADLANAQVSLLTAQNDLNVAQANLKNAMGLVASQELTTSADNPALPSFTADTRNVEDYVKAAYNNRYDIKQQQEQVYAQGYQVKTAILQNGLNFNATITQGYQLDPNAGQNRTFSVSISYPLFDGGNTRAAIRDSKAQLESQKRSLDQLEQNIRLNVEQSWLVRELGRRRVNAAQLAVRAAELNYQVAQERQRNGLINVLELINAQVQLTNAEGSFVQAIYDYYISDAQLQRNIGVNDPEYTPKVPGAKPIRSSLLMPTWAQSATTLNMPNTESQSLLETNLLESTRKP
jgi:outer membrane protein TolC